MERQRQGGREQGLLPLGLGLRLFLFMFACLMPAGLVQAAPVVALTDNFSRIALGEYLETLEDAEHSLTLTEIREASLASRFVANRSGMLKMGLTDSAWWIRFNVHNPAPQQQQLVLELDRASLSHITLFAPDNQGFYQQRDAGVLTSNIIADESSNHYVFHLSAAPESITTYYLRIETHLGLTSPITLSTPAGMTTANRLETGLTGIALGILGGLALYSLLLLYGRDRDRTNVYFVLYLITLMLYLLAANGYLGVELLRIRNLQNFLEICSVFLSHVAASLFAGSFLQGHLTDRFPRLMQIQALIIGLLMILALTVAPGHAAIIMAVSSVWTALVLLIAGSISWRNGFRPAGLYMLARLIRVLAIGAAILNVPIDTILPGSGLVMASLCIEGLLIAAALASRQRIHMRENARRQEQIRIREAETRAKSDFLSQMSHEIRTPMSGILGMTELLADTPLTAGQREYVSTIHASSNSLLRILNDILDHSKMEAGKLTVVDEPFDMNVLLNECLTLFKAHAEDKHLELIATIDPQLPTLVLGDPTRLRQVISNLLRNAIKFTQHGEVELRLQPCARGLRVEVRDTGIGIPAERLSSIFLPPQAGSTLPSTVGTGLGLSICKQLVELMGGEIGVFSQPREGSTFWFELPLKPQSTTQPTDPIAEQWLRGLRLLVVDDNQTVNRVVAEQAGRWGMLVRTADNGAEALALARNSANLGEPFDIILLDHNMPGMSGLQLAARIKEDPIIRNDVIIMMLTGISVAPTHTMTRNVGIRRILTKPVTERQLKTAIAEELGHLKRLQEETPAIDLADKEQLQNMRILIAEDNHLSQKVIRGMLGKLGVQATVVANGREVVEEFSRQEYDVVLMDCDMPFMDGYAATQAIREWEKVTGRKPVPILALTAHILDEHRLRSREAGMNEHITKPVEMAELQSALLRWAPRKTIA